MVLFPKFKRLTTKDKLLIEKHIQKFPPYSDFNFTSLWSYNIKGTVEFSFLNSNLVVKFEDYITGKPFLSFLGNVKVKQTIQDLIEYASSNKIDTELKLIPEHNVRTNGLSSLFNIIEDLDNNDYIFSINDNSLKGKKYETQRNLINRFKKRNPNFKISAMDVSDELTKKQIYKLFNIWEDRKKLTREFTKNERTAIKRLLRHSKKFKLISLGLYIDGKLAAFSINEVIHDKYAITHFLKANTHYPGIYSFIEFETMQSLKSFGCNFLNFEQDLGIESLRYAKNAWRPFGFLKKFVITKKLNK